MLKDLDKLKTLTAQTNGARCGAARNRRLSRRRFLELMGLTAAGAALGACGPTTPVAVTPTPSPEPPTPTPLPPLEIVTEPAGFEMVLVESGSFEMGSNSGRPNESPAHQVQLTRSYFMARLEVTWDQYDGFCSDTSRRMRTDRDMGRGDRPAIANWYDAIEYCNWLSERAGLAPCYTVARLATECDFAASGYRLATEAEWEYAARGGSRGQGYAYAGSDDADQVAWHAGNSGGITQPVGQLQPNELGLYDMNGNLWEWCWDWYQRDFYAHSPATDPVGPELASTQYSDVQKVLRGGHWVLSADEISVTIRSYDGPDYEEDGSAIRLVRAA